MIMRGFEQRFKEPAPTELVDELAKLPPGATASIRHVVFTKVSRYRWRNDFRENITTRQVASVLAEGEHTINSHPTQEARS
jgi:hypothetical protein